MFNKCGINKTNIENKENENFDNKINIQNIDKILPKPNTMIDDRARYSMEKEVLISKNYKFKRNISNNWR
jgi:hypothetical protein